jgi:hypothetical protein
MTLGPEGPEPKRLATLKYILIAVLVTVIAVVVTLWLLSIMLIGYAPACPCLPTASWSDPEVLGPTQANVAFVDVNPEISPTDLLIILVVNDSSEGRYVFQPDDNIFLRETGDYVGTLYFEDLAEDGEVDSGDVIRMRDLKPDSDYIIRMYWAPTGDRMAEESFKTPPN